MAEPLLSLKYLPLPTTFSSLQSKEVAAAFGAQEQEEEREDEDGDVEVVPATQPVGDLEDEEDLEEEAAPAKSQKASSSQKLGGSKGAAPLKEKKSKEEGRKEEGQRKKRKGCSKKKAGQCLVMGIQEVEVRDCAPRGTSGQAKGHLQVRRGVLINAGHKQVAGE